MKILKNKIDVLIDTDVGFDDYLAILYLLKHSDVNVKEISITGTGDVYLSYGGRNISNLLTLLEDVITFLCDFIINTKTPIQVLSIGDASNIKGTINRFRPLETLKPFDSQVLFSQ